MAIINIKDDKFTCPMLKKEISERGEVMFATCAKCKNNSLGQFIDDKVYCTYKSGSTSSDSGEQSGGSSDYDNIDDFMKDDSLDGEEKLLISDNGVTKYVSIDELSKKIIVNNVETEYDHDREIEQLKTNVEKMNNNDYWETQS